MNGSPYSPFVMWIQGIPLWSINSVGLEFHILRPEYKPLSVSCPVWAHLTTSEHTREGQTQRDSKNMADMQTILVILFPRVWNPCYTSLVSLDHSSYLNILLFSSSSCCHRSRSLLVLHQFIGNRCFDKGLWMCFKDSLRKVGAVEAEMAASKAGL